MILSIPETCWICLIPPLFQFNSTPSILHNLEYTGGSEINPKVDIDFAKKECHKLMEHGTDAVKWLGIFTGVLSMLQIITGTGIMVGLQPSGETTEPFVRLDEFGWIMPFTIYIRTGFVLHYCDFESERWSVKCASRMSVGVD